MTIIMAWESCVVMLNSDSTGRFYSGDIVTGSVILEFKHEQKIERIDFQVRGISKAQWTRPMPTIPYIRIYSENNNILDYDIGVFSEIEGKTVQPGIQTFHFHFILPVNLPSTFESPIAKLHYFIKIKGKAAFKFKKQKIVPFIVHGNINLNDMEDYLIPTFIESEKTLWNSGKVSIRFKTYKGFAPRQYAPFEILIVNEKKVKISKINVTLLQKNQYNITSGNSGYANDERKICKVVHTKFSNTLTENCYFGMDIPQTIPSSIHLTNPMIEISYILRVEVVFPYHATLYEDIPVTIATIPVLHHDFDQRTYNIK